MNNTIRTLYMTVHGDNLCNAEKTLEESFLSQSLMGRDILYGQGVEKSCVHIPQKGDQVFILKDDSLPKSIWHKIGTIDSEPISIGEDGEANGSYLVHFTSDTEGYKIHVSLFHLMKAEPLKEISDSDLKSLEIQVYYDYKASISSGGEGVRRAIENLQTLQCEMDRRNLSHADATNFFKVVPWKPLD